MTAKPLPPGSTRPWYACTGSPCTCPKPASAKPRDADPQLVTYLQTRRRDALRALRASTEAGADYWRWQGHAELSRQLLERLGAEVPQ